MKFLVLAAHPDDEVLGCGGTIARLSQEGHQVTIAILGEGITSRFKRRKDGSKSSIKTLKNASKNAVSKLGASNLISLDLPDNRFDSLDLLDIIKLVEDLIEKVNPDCIFTHHGGDLNIDHRVVFQATITAARPLPDSRVKAIYTYEIPSSTDWSFQQFNPSFAPNLFFDISKTIQQKIKALMFYELENRLYPHPRSPQAIKIIAQRWGTQIGVDSAEAFEIIRETR